MKLKKLAQLIALLGAAGPSLAHEALPAQPMARVEITGSSIKRIATEGAMPIQVITFDQIEKQGVTNAEQLMRMISANGTGADNMTSGNNVFGADADRVSGGASFASLRGLGPGSTLVLLNGRRVATHGASGKAVDLNAIPLGAIARIEILKDGASAIYGTDAVGGVINFILRTDYNGLEASAGSVVTQAGGGATRRASLLTGTGSMEKDGFNIMGSLTVDTSDKLSSHQRGFANGYQPDRGLSPDTTGTPFANQLGGAGSALGANFKLAGDTTDYTAANPLSYQGKCDTIAHMAQYNVALWRDVTPPAGTRFACTYDYGADYMMMPQTKRINALVRGSLRLSADHKMFVELLSSRSQANAELTPAQISTTLARNSAYPVNGPYYQDLSAYISTFDKTKPILYKWRTSELGNRAQENITDNARLLVGFDGIVGGYDYKLGLSRAQSKTQTNLTGGYAYITPFHTALGTGIINPWLAPGQSQTPAAIALIDSTRYYGPLQHGKTTLTQLDGTISGDLFSLPAGAVSAAVGFDLRRESYAFAQDIDATLVLLGPGNAGLPTATRDVKAVFAELLVPVLKNLDLQLAIRRDQYSIFGATTNPKVGVRYQPSGWLLLRGSANKGFLAPSFTQLYTGSLDQELPNGVADPVGCPQHPGDARYCNIARLPYKSGGNPNLRPETSKQGTIGFVIEPFKGFSASLDYWAINSANHILNPTPTAVLAFPVALAGNIIRNDDGTIRYVQAGWMNASGSKLRGADLGLRGNGKVADYKWTATLDGTYVNSAKFSDVVGQSYKEYVGNFFARDMYLRWKHNATLGVTRGDWSALLSQSFSTGYKDQLPDAGKSTPPAGFNPDVASYTTFGLTANYTGYKATTLTFGIQNLFDRDPPFTAHNVDEVVGAGWDPRVADPRGRSFSFQIKYKFL
ncbi:MAG: TonB-dependent receptor [Massilia sp.]